MKMTALVSYHLSNAIKKKSVSGFFRLICLEPIFLDSYVLSPFYLRPICFKAFFLQKVTSYYKPTNQVSVAR
jgi:hypothetical protein